MMIDLLKKFNFFYFFQLIKSSNLFYFNLFFFQKPILFYSQTLKFIVYISYLTTLKINNLNFKFDKFSLNYYFFLFFWVLFCLVFLTVSFYF